MSSTCALDVIAAGEAMVVFTAQQVGPLNTMASFGRFLFAALHHAGPSLLEPSAPFRRRRCQSAARCLYARLDTSSWRVQKSLPAVKASPLRDLTLLSDGEVLRVLGPCCTSMVRQDTKTRAYRESIGNVWVRALG